MNIFKKILKAAGSLIPGVGIVKSIIAPEKSQQEKTDGLAMLTPIAQYNLTMARPRIMTAIVFTYLGGTIARWIQVICGTDKVNLIDMPEKLVGFAVIVVGIISGTRGIEKIVGKIFKRKEK